ncbi:hypothetical protein B0T24DRAFT_518556 [Lasiosphaeria ovina]|uniref:Xylanolytic transcriptional activator regulatory domain-containing protein n=1 Tax=Lasiosphaeria ovina TaxID=92902 RepID=A0AAE0TY94_9PEZI|nr:hypothetical protein B0T24DRAFT_518556 [Lasiosphaeria ovina]
MASLKFIMDINDDHQTDARQPNKKDKDSGLPSTGIHNNHPHPPPHPRHVSSSSGLAIGQNINQPAPAAQNKRRGASARGPKLAASSAATASSSSSSSLSLPLSLPAATPSTRPPPARRPSTASNDSMDPTGYGSAASSASMGAGGMHPSNTSMRPMPSHTQSSDVPMRLTPITGRVSRAKKGVPVHICDICKPTKVRLDIRALPSSGFPVRPVGGSSPLLSHHGAGAYQQAGDASNDYRGFPSPTMPIQQTTLPAAVYNMPYQQSPRTMPPSICVVTQGLQNSEPPELYHQSPWAASSTDSTYSTPSDSRYPRYWPSDARTQLLSSYPNPRPQADLPITPSPALPSRLDAPGRHKGGLAEVHQDVLGTLGGMGGIGMFTGHSVGFGSADASPGGGNGGNHHGMGILTDINLPIGGGGGGGGECGVVPGLAMASSLQRQVLAAIPGYLDTYWARVHPLFPLVHRASFEAVPEDFLRCAMAAVATQYLPGKEDRIRGSQLHEHAVQEVKRIPQWSSNVQAMQAILLCEYFSRFRGRKAITRPSKLFECLYSRTQSQVAGQAYSQCLSNPQVLYHPAMFDEAGLDSDSVQDRWHRWVEADAYRRLLAACFFVDGHAAIFQQQRRAHECDISGMAPLPQMPLFGRSSKLWEAFSAREWAELLSTDPEAGIPTYVPPPDQLTPEYVLGLGHFDRKVALSIEVLRLPSRQMTPTTSASGHSSPISDADPHMQHVGSQFNPDQQPHFQHAHQLDPQDSLSIDAEQRISALFRTCPTANVYLALHHTPLQDLLAVGGDSWIFSKKVLPATSFAVHQKRLKAWTEQHQRLASNNNYADAVAGLSAAKATMYAARAIVGYLQRAQPGTGLLWTNDLSDYWGLYVCALICWAFAGHRMRGTSTAPLLDPRPARQRRGSNGGGSGGSSPTSRGPGNSGNAAAAADEEAMGWLEMAAADGMRPEDVVRARGGREALGVVGLVRRRLENDCVGSRSRLYVDAVVVLRKLEEGANWN